MTLLKRCQFDRREWGGNCIHCGRSWIGYTKDPRPLLPPARANAAGGYQPAPSASEVGRPPGAESSANAVQVGGDHYRRQVMQPWDAIEAWGLGFLDGNVVEYAACWRHRGGIADLKKARQYLDKLIEEQEKARDKTAAGEGGA